MSNYRRLIRNLRTGAHRRLNPLTIAFFHRLNNKELPVKHVKSTDPRKPAICAALRKAATQRHDQTAGRCTCVIETATGFEGSVFIRNKGQKGYGDSRLVVIDASEVHSGEAR